MAAIDVVRKYLDSGMSYAQVTREKAEEIVRDLVKAGEVRAEEAQDAVKDLVDRSRRQSEALSERVRTEVRDQLARLQPASQSELDALVSRVDGLEKKVKAATKKPAAKKSSATKPAAKKSAG